MTMTFCRYSPDGSACKTCPYYPPCGWTRRYDTGRFCYDCGYSHTMEQHREWIREDQGTERSEEMAHFKKPVKWGLLRSPAVKTKLWSFVNDARWLFDTRERALEQANEFNTGSGEPAYLYRPIRVKLEVDIDDKN